MKKESCKILGILLLGMFFLSVIPGVLAIDANGDGYDDDTGEYVGADRPGPSTAAGAVFDPVRDMFAEWDRSGAISENVAKYLFLILMALIVYTALDWGGFISSSGIKWAISAIVAFLSVAYLAPQEVWLVLLSYNALGTTLLFLFPMVILALFSFRMIKDGGAQGLVAQLIIWIVYFIFLIYRLIYGFITGFINIGDSNTWIYVTAILLVGIAVFANKPIRKWLAKIMLEATTEAAQGKIDKATSNIQQQAGMQEGLGG